MDMTILQEDSTDKRMGIAASVGDRLLCKHPLRIVHMVSSLQVGGMEQFVLRIANEQLRRGHKVAVIGLQGGPLLEQAQSLGLQAMALNGLRRIPRLIRVTRHLIRLRPDVVHVHNSSPLPYALLSKMRGRARVIMTRHGLTERIPLASSRQLRYTDAVVAVSEAAAVALKRSRPDCADKITVIPNGVESAKPLRSRREVRASLGLGDELVGVIVARVDNAKGHSTLLRALALLQEQDIRLTMLVVGDGPERSRVESLAQHLELGCDRVRFLGFRSDVSDLLGAADLFVLPSLTEGMPISVLEAMAQALPIVATSVGGIPELIAEPHQGILIPVNDPAALSNALIRLASDPLLRCNMGGAACRRAREHFSFEEMARKYEALYMSLS